MLKGIKAMPDHRLLVGFDTADDAAVFKINDGLALVLTVDFLTPMVDDPYVFGQVAAANALSDVYAMGGEPLAAMNIVCYPACEDISILREIVRGGQDKIEEAGAVLAGGHSVDDNEPKYGLAVVGVVHPERFISNKGAKPGDYLYLTKPIGTGIITTAIKGDMAEQKIVEECTNCMRRLNKEARDAMVKVGVIGATDITGFSLAGHLHQMLVASGVKATLWAERIPVLPGALELAAMGMIPGGAYRNREHFGQVVSFAPDISEALRDLVFGPETSGGLLVAVSPEKRNDWERELSVKGLHGGVIGRVTGKGRGEIEVVRSEEDGKNS